MTHTDPRVIGGHSLPHLHVGWRRTPGCGTELHETCGSFLGVLVLVEFNDTQSKKAHSLRQTE